MLKAGPGLQISLKIKLRSEAKAKFFSRKIAKRSENIFRLCEAKRTSKNGMISVDWKLAANRRQISNLANWTTYCRLDANLPIGRLKNLELWPTNYQSNPIRIGVQLDANPNGQPCS